MKKILLTISLMLLTATMALGQTWQLTAREPSYVKTFAVAENGDVWAGGAPNEFYRYSNADGVWREADGVADLQNGTLVRTGNGNLVAIPGDGIHPVSISTNNGGTWNEVNGTLNIASSSWNVYGNTILGVEGTVSTDGGETWKKFFNKDSLVGKYYPYGDGIMFIETSAYPFNYYYFSPEDSSLVRISEYAYKREASLNSEYMNTHCPDSVRLPFKTGYMDCSYTLDGNGNPVLYREDMANEIYRLKNGRWEIVNYGEWEPKDNINCLFDKYAIGDSCVFSINYDSIFCFQKLPSECYMGLDKKNVDLVSGKLYINPETYDCRKVVVYDLSSKEFTNLNSGLPGKNILQIESNELAMYARDINGHVFKSSNDGISWEDLGGFGTTKISVTDSVIRSTLYESTNNGRSWKVVRDPSGSIFDLYSDNVNLIRVVGPTQEMLSLEGSTDNGSTFTTLMVSITNPLSIYTKNNVYLASSRTNAIYIIDSSLTVDTTNSSLRIYTFTSFGNTYFGGTDSGIVKLERNEVSGSLRKGVAQVETWALAGLEGKKVLSLTTDSDGVVYAGTSDGTYYTTDFGTTWDVYGKVASENLKKTKASVGGLSAVNAMIVRGDEIFAAANEGLYKTKVHGKISVADPGNGAEVVESYSLSQNYPNPFNPSTTIRYNLASAGKVSLKVYNVLGQEIAILVNGLESAGMKDVRFDGAGLPSGIYIYRLEGEGNSGMTRKMILLK